MTNYLIEMVLGNKANISLSYRNIINQNYRWLMCVPRFYVNCVTLEEFGYALVVNGPTTFMTSPRAFGIADLM